MLDGIVFWVFSALLGALVSVLFVGESPGLVVLPPGVYDALSSLIGLVLGIGVPYAYWVYPIGRWGATLGKRAFGLMVVDRRGAPPGQAKALGRALLVILLGWLALLPWWPVPFRIDRRGLHDLATDVWVIDERRTNRAAALGGGSGSGMGAAFATMVCGRETEEGTWRSRVWFGEASGS
jgi:uncharacterized RDD family membrane protein YckC